jgi:hypothetical protein
MAYSKFSRVNEAIPTDDIFERSICFAMSEYILLNIIGNI